MPMSRKDYDKLAELLRTYGNPKDPAWSAFGQDLILYLKHDNPNFDINRFLKACHPTED